ncbi:MAG: polysaccharide deacetylase family protein, partial [Clostridium sp.]|nr:polysaccharide deacetylase family protein [Clostridium sp.]
MRNNFNDDNRQELYKSQYRIKQSRKMRRRRAGFYTVTGLVFAVGLFFAGDYVMGILQKTDSPAQSLAVETPTEEAVANDTVKFIKGEGNVAIDFASTLPPKIDFSAIEPGKNHSIKASSYAYPLEEVKQWMKGEGSFEDKKIAFLTFDDGPVYNTVKVLDVLKEKNVPGNFFIPGNALANYDDKT